MDRSHLGSQSFLLKITSANLRVSLQGTAAATTELASKASWTFVNSARLSKNEHTVPTCLRLLTRGFDPRTWSLQFAQCSCY